jgi:hypothetical protein
VKKKKENGFHLVGLLQHLGVVLAGSGRHRSTGSGNSVDGPAARIPRRRPGQGPVVLQVLVM